MRILLDQNISPEVAISLPGHIVTGAIAAGFEGFKNGRLLGAAEDAGYDVLLTVDKNMRHQQNFSGRRISLIVLDIHPIGIRAVTACSGAVLKVAEHLTPGEVVVIDGPHPKRSK